MGAEPEQREPSASGGAAAGPPAVGRAAAERGLGTLVDVRREVTPLIAVGRGAAIVVGGVVLLLVVGFISMRQPNPSWTRTITLWLTAAVLGLQLYAVVSMVRALVLGTRTHYLFTGGLVHRRRGDARAVAWEDVDRLVPIYNYNPTGPAGRLLGYRVLVGGIAIARIPLVLAEGRDAFVDRILDNLGAPAHPTGGPVLYQRATDEQREIWRAHGARSIVVGVLWVLIGAALMSRWASMTSSGTLSLVYGSAIAYGVYRLVRGYLMTRKAGEKTGEKAGG